MKSNIRKWGNSAGLIIPAAALAESNLKLGDAVDIEARQGEIVIREAAASYTLDQLLDASPGQAVPLDDEDEAWLNDEPQGGEAL